MNRSYLFAPGHNKKLVGKVFDAGSQLPIIHAEFSPHEDELHWAPWGEHSVRRQPNPFPTPATDGGLT